MDTWPSFQTVDFVEFKFHVNKYDEYIEGNLNSSGITNFDIMFKQHNYEYSQNRRQITVDLINNPIKHKIISNIDFDLCVTMGDRLMVYIYAEKSNVDNIALNLVGSILGYTRNEKIYIENEPIIGNIFTENYNTINKISFSFVNPNRLIEFY